MNFSKPKGTYDVLPKESARWQNVESLIREICSIFNYKEIRTPMFESTQLYHRSAGETSDVVSKETYEKYAPSLDEAFYLGTGFLDEYYGSNVPLFRRNGYRQSGTMIP